MEALEPHRCRRCAHFIRVNFNGYRNVTNRQGFCLYGQLEGDWSLYVSTSGEHNCVGFVHSVENARIFEAERKLSKDHDDFIKSLSDKRTTNYKAIKPLMDAHKDFFESIQKERGGIAWMTAHNKIRELGSEHFNDVNAERYREVYHMVSLKKVHYLRFLAGISSAVHDRFCDCGVFMGGAPE